MAHHLMQAMIMFDARTENCIQDCGSGVRSWGPTLHFLNYNGGRGYVIKFEESSNWEVKYVNKFINIESFRF